MTKALQSTSYDVVVASTEMMADYVRLSPAGTLRVLEEHNSMTRWAYERYQHAGSVLERLRSWANWQKRRRYEARYYPRFDLITMVSESDQQVTVETVGPDNPPVVTVSNGVDTKHNRPGLATVKRNNLIFNGALTYDANYDAMDYLLAEIYPLIKMEVPEVSLTITGSTEGVALDGLALYGSVRLTGYVDDVRIPVTEAAVCVTPIRQGGGTRLKILEAMALGTPVVSTSKGAEGLDVIDGEHLLLADDPEAFAHCVVSLLGDSARRRQLAEAARKRVEERYDWQQIGREFVLLVEDTVAEKRGVKG